MVMFFFVVVLLFFFYSYQLDIVLCACTILSIDLFVIVGKHPVSALQEICAKKHWDPPHYELLELGGPAHKKNFLYKVGD